MRALGFLLLPFLECLVLVGIHSYLGIHVLKRKVIFVDLAFAQIAALGCTVAFLFGLPPESPGAYVFSLLATFCAAGVFAITRLRREKVPQEAIIGLTYAIAASVAILAVDRGPSGSEHIKDIMAGSILWVSRGDVLIAAAVYSVIGLFHFAFRDRFLLISNDPGKAADSGMNVRLWDFFFYLSFGLVISISVRTAGVLLVFVFLVAPAMLALLLTDRLLPQLLIGWGLGTLVSVLGFAASNSWDLPAGPAVVSLYGLVLVVAAVTIYVVGHKRAAFRRALVGAGVVVAAGGIFCGLGRGMASSVFWSRSDDHIDASEDQAAVAFVEDRRRILGEEKREKVIDTAGPQASKLVTELAAMDVAEQELHAAELTDPGLLSNAFEAVEDDGLRMTLARRLFEIDPRRGAEALATVASTSKLEFCRAEALDLLVGNCAAPEEGEVVGPPEGSHQSN